jgi:hypothetical protein
MNYMFNLEDYETVAMLNKWFIDNYPMGRTNIEITYHDVEKGYITCKAEVYRDVNDPNPAASNIAHGVRDLYNSNMRRFYAEDIASSSLGRAITLLKGGQTATRDDMEKVSSKPFEKRLEDKITVPVESDPWSIKMVEAPATSAEAIANVKEILGGQTDKDIPKCPHGEMYWKTGKTKTGKPWGHFKCPASSTGEMNRCDKDKEVIWYEIKPDGTWGRQKDRF